MEIEQLKYPVGRFQFSGIPDDAQRKQWISEIAAYPEQLRAAVAGLTDEQLDTPYRPEGWTVRQVVHHVADSHMNSYIRFKLALTEDTPTIKPYEEQLWAELADSSLPVSVSLALLENVHTRWVALLEAMSEADYQRSFVHPASGATSLGRALGLYAWHGRHHLTHITALAARMGWRQA